MLTMGMYGICSLRQLYLYRQQGGEPLHVSVPRGLHLDVRQTLAVVYKYSFQCAQLIPV